MIISTHVLIRRSVEKLDYQAAMHKLSFTQSRQDLNIFFLIFKSTANVFFVSLLAGLTFNVLMQISTDLPTSMQT